nr:putative F-box/LRR-repeat protein 23 [Ipomoea batatas]
MYFCCMLYRAKQLRHLGIRYRLVSDEGFSKAVNEFPLLEELQLKYSAISKQGIEAAGKSCPFLNSFSFVKASLFLGQPSDEEAVAIAENMHGLNHLTLGENEMSDEGLEAILDACPSLQSLNITDCNYVRLEGELEKRCSQQIKDLNHIHSLGLRFFDEDLLWEYISDDFNL